MKDHELRSLLDNDLQEVYGFDLDDYYSGDISFFKLSRRAAGLRMGARIYRGTPFEWTQEQHMLADAIDLLQRDTWLQYMIAQGLGAEEKHFKRPPAPLWRPGDETDEQESEQLLSSDKGLQGMLQTFGISALPGG